LCWVSNVWINTTDSSALPQGVQGDGDHLCEEVAAKEGSSLGLEADEARIMVSKPYADILLLLHCQLLPSVLGEALP